MPDAAAMEPLTRPALLLVTSDAGLRSEVARLAAAANVGVDTVDVAAAPEPWRTSPAVLVGADVAAHLADLGPGRRDDVRVVGDGPSHEAVLRAALALGAGGVVELPEDSDLLGAWLADLGDRAGDRPAQGLVVGVLGASGGVGSSVLALAVAEVAAPEGPSLLVDLDPWGLPAGVLAGVTADASTEPVTWADLAALEGRIGARALRESLPSRDGLRVLGWGPVAPADGPPGRVLREVVAAARRGHEVVVLDVPRSGATREALGLCDAVVVVSTPTLAGSAGAARVRALLPAGVAAGVVVRPVRGAWPEDLARLVGLPLWAVLPAQRGLDEHLAAGLGAVRSRRSPCARAARDVLSAITGP